MENKLFMSSMQFKPYSSSFRAIVVYCTVVASVLMMNEECDAQHDTAYNKGVY